MARYKKQLVNGCTLSFKIEKEYFDLFDNLTVDENRSDILRALVKKWLKEHGAI